MANVYSAEKGNRYTIVLNREEGKALLDIVSDIVTLQEEPAPNFYTDDVYQLARDIKDKLQ